MEHAPHWGLGTPQNGQPGNRVFDLLYFYCTPNLLFELKYLSRIISLTKWFLLLISSQFSLGRHIDLGGNITIHGPWLPSPTSCTCLGKGTSFCKPAESTALLHQWAKVSMGDRWSMKPRTKWEVNTKIAGMLDDVWRGSSQIWEWWEWFIRFDLYRQIISPIMLIRFGHENLNFECMMFAMKLVDRSTTRRLMTTHAAKHGRQCC